MMLTLCKAHYFIQFHGLGLLNMLNQDNICQCKQELETGSTDLVRELWFLVGRNEADVTIKRTQMVISLHLVKDDLLNVGVICRGKLLF